MVRTYRSCISLREGEGRARLVCNVLISDGSLSHGQPGGTTTQHCDLALCNRLVRIEPLITDGSEFGEGTKALPVNSTDYLYAPMTASYGRQA